MLRKVIAEPLVHFMLIGLGLFVLYQLVTPDGTSDRRIIVSDATVAMLAQRHEAVWMRPPTPEQLRALIDTHIREEILYREGMALGLDRNDQVIQRRVLQKLDVLTEESSSLESTDGCGACALFAGQCVALCSAAGVFFRAGAV